MPSSVYTFIATRTSYASTIPLGLTNMSELNRRVRGALLATGFPTRVGDLIDRPRPASIENFLLCDGSEVAKIDFPELWAYLEPEAADNEGLATDTANFLLPDYVGAKTQATTAPPQVVVGGTVQVGTAPTTPPASPGTSGGTVGNPPSGGRPRVIGEFEE